MTYKLLGGIGTRRRVAFACPSCGAELQAPLSDAGRIYPCPTCSREFVVPGADVLLREAASAAALAEQHREAAAAASEPLPFAIPEPDDGDDKTQASQLEYASTRRPAAQADADAQDAPPDYRQIVAAARLVIVFAYLAFGLGLFGLVVAAAVYLMGVARNSYDRAAATALALGLLPPALILIATGSVLYLLAHVGLAVRDIARNSYRR